MFAAVPALANYPRALPSDAEDQIRRSGKYGDLLRRFEHPRGQLKATDWVLAKELACVVGDARLRGAMPFSAR